MKSMLLTLVLAGSCFASETEFVPWQSVVIKSPAIADAGVVTVEASVEGDDWKALKVECHGRTHTLTSEDLKGLKRFPLASIEISAAGGYQPIGGHTVSLRFKRNFVDEAQRPKAEVAHLMIPKYGPFKVLLHTE